ncbi:chemotaxis protein CheW [Chryseolinea sp. H1M3-3]|uniref:chemotaxis protein CheW n=1 Tax=Chryseolinea sp. H1M3-3 TaxID=3034144 RepID=UPI0023EC09C5|nr:chemotaxis protein CheW [Chryseolinea sp. H1M3-3]
MIDSKQNDSQQTGIGNERSTQIVVFKLGQEEYGLHIDQIKEVVITPNITRMPQTSSFMRGVANIRGNVIAILDLENKFGLECSNDHAVSENNFTLVIESDEYKMGILVRDVPNTLSISSASIENAVFTGDNQAGQSYITGIVKLEKRLIIMIDIFKVINDQDVQLFKKQNGLAA